MRAHSELLFSSAYPLCAIQVLTDLTGQVLALILFGNQGLTPIENPANGRLFRQSEGGQAPPIPLKSPPIKAVQ
jgi:hypothetical protein